MKDLQIILICLLMSTIYKVTEGANLTDNIDGPPVTRSEVILTAHTFTRIHWFNSERNRTANNPDSIFLSQYPVEYRVGIGYKWSAWDDVETFLTKIDEGCGTGTGGYVTYEEYPFESVTGTSCTGFVSRTWQLDHKYTLTYPNQPDIPRQFHEITQEIKNVDFHNHQTSALKKGDVFMNSHHIILFIYETRDGTAMIMDSAGEGVGFREMSWKDLADNGYKSLRYNNIVEIDNPQGTVSNPIVIDSDQFPFMTEGNTRDVVSTVFDRYNSDTSLNEQGPEIIYQLDLKAKGNILIIKRNILNQGIDNDLYLLSSLCEENHTALDCIKRGDSRIIQELEQGTYYIVVDSGKDQPGEFQLTVDYFKKNN